MPTVDRRALEMLGHEIREIPGIAAASLATCRTDGSCNGAGDPRKGGSAIRIETRDPS